MRGIGVRIREWLIIPKGCPVKSINVRARLLKFLLEEKGVRYVRVLDSSAGCVTATLTYLTRPIVITAGIRITTQEIRIVLANKESRVRIVKRIGCRGTAVVIDDCDGRRAR